MRPEPLEERRKRLSRLLSRNTNAMRDGIQLSETITGDGAAIFRHACGLGFEGIVSERTGSPYVSGRTRAWLKTKNPGRNGMTLVVRSQWAQYTRGGGLFLADRVIVMSLGPGRI